MSEGGAVVEQPPKLHRNTLFHSGGRVKVIPLDTKNVPVLTKPEIRKDMREIQRSLQADSDSECSVLSEDVLMSEYPVKPRKTPRWHQSHHDHDSHGATRGGTDGANGGAPEVYDPEKADAAIASIKSIQKSHNDLYQKELEREIWDQKRQSYQTSAANAAKKFNIERKEQEYYYRVLQAAHFRSLLLLTSQVKQNTMMWDVLQSLRRRKAAADVIDAELLKLKQQHSNAKPARSSKGKPKGAKTEAADADLADGASAVLQVKLKQSGAEVVIYKGQWMATPMGEGCVERILPKEHKVHIKLAFGTMYAHLSRCVFWGLTAKLAEEPDGTGADAASANRATEGAATTKNGTSGASAEKGGDKGSSHGSSGKSKGRSSSRRATGNDAMDVVGETTTAPASGVEDFENMGEALDLSGDRAMLLQWQLLQHRITMPSSALRGVNAALAPIIAADGAVDKFAEGTTGERFDLYGALGMGAPTPAEEEGDLEKDHRMLSSLSQPNMGPDGPSMTKAYHLPLTQDPQRSRLAMRRAVVVQEPDSLLRDPLLVMTPPTNLPHFAQAKIMSGNQELYLEPQALSGASNATTQHCTSASLTWEADTGKMQSTLKERSKTIESLESELNAVQASISAMRRTSAKLASETSATRMKMFTRRIRHRNTLLDHGIDLSTNTLPPNLQPGGTNGNQEAIAAMLADMDPSADPNDKEPSTHPGTKGKGWPGKKESRDRGDHAVIEIGGQIIGKPGGRGKPPGWGTAQGRYSSGGSIPIPGFEEIHKRTKGASAAPSDDAAAAGESGGDGSSQVKKRPRTVEADWLANNPVVTGKRDRSGAVKDGKDGGASSSSDSASGSPSKRRSTRVKGGKSEEGSDDDEDEDEDDQKEGEGDGDDEEDEKEDKKKEEEDKKEEKKKNGKDPKTVKKDEDKDEDKDKDEGDEDGDDEDEEEDEEKDTKPSKSGTKAKGGGKAKGASKSAKSEPSKAKAKKPPAKRARR